MITRIVRMEFHPQHTEDFQKIFTESSPFIRQMPGCLYLSLHRDADNASVFYTISKWNEPDNLEFYRKSELFGKTWKATKALFSAPPSAWSLNPEAELL